MQFGTTTFHKALRSVGVSLCSLETALIVEGAGSTADRGRRTSQTPCLSAVARNLNHFFLIRLFLFRLFVSFRRSRRFSPVFFMSFKEYLNLGIPTFTATKRSKARKALMQRNNQISTAPSIMKEDRTDLFALAHSSYESRMERYQKMLRGERNVFSHPKSPTVSSRKSGSCTKLVSPSPVPVECP